MLKYMLFVHVLLLAKVTDHVSTARPHDCNGNECVLVDAALQDIGTNFDSHVCHAFHHVNCALHTLIKDEQICGSDGVTYATHCLFAVARCRSLSGHGHDIVIPLTIASHGPCGSLAHTSVPVATGSASSVPVSTTSAAAPASTLLQSLSTISLSSSMSSASSAATTTSSPTTPSTATTPPPTATSPAPTTPPAPISTTISTHSILGSVFCQYQTSISCGPVFAVVCGSNGKFYPNKCELLKEQCLDPTLRETADTTHCSLGP